MARLENALRYVRETREVLRSVNALVTAVDPIFTRYLWLTTAFYALRGIGLFTLAAALVGHVIHTPKLDWSLVMLGVGGFAVFLALSTFINSWGEERRDIFQTLLRTQLEVRHTEKLASLDLGRLVDPAFIRLTHMSDRRGDNSVLQLYFAQRDIFGASVALIASGGILLSLDPLLAVLTVCLAVPNVLQHWYEEQKKRDLTEAEWLVRRQRNEVAEAITDTNTAVLNRLLRLTRHFMARYIDLSSLLLQNVRTLARYERRWNVGVGLTTAVCAAVAGLYFAKGILAGRYSYIEVGAIFGSLQAAAGALGRFGWSFGRIGSSRIDYEYLERFLATKPLVDDTDCKPIVLSRTPELVLEDVSFAYPGSDTRAIDACSITVAPGEKVALVGPNGCGKTTLLRLVARIYTPGSGRVWADEHDLRFVRQDSWLTYAVMVTQAAALPGMEIARALTGTEQDRTDKDRLGTALTLSGAASLVADLPYGLHTWLGAQWPQGKGFSTGELQRFALAAAFYRLLEPSVYVGMFDEPTANLDAGTKKRFYGALASAPEFAHKTILVTIHDPLYLQYFDRVLLFEKGRLVKDLRTKEEIEAYRTSIALSLATDL